MLGSKGKGKRWMEGGSGLTVNLLCSHYTGMTNRSQNTERIELLPRPLSPGTPDGRPNKPLIQVSFYILYCACCQELTI